jgi:hypothetical protein
MLLTKDDIDDIFCVINRCKVGTIKYTCEEEVDGSLPCLDVRVTRRDSRLEFNVYRKPTDTQRCIFITSCHPMVHKMAAFHFMLHRVCNLPLSRINFEKDVAYIKETETTIDGLLSKHLFKRKIKKLTTLSPISKEVTTERAGLPFHPGISRKNSNIMPKHDIQMVPKAPGKLSQVLLSLNDAEDDKEKSDVYEIQCQICSAV